ncbi:Methyltransferase small [Penicillium digitatum]|uniref:Methyltransferase small n=1 Tax=Penicillium digitatum TaxID=36651 RepID=A0A7T6XK43_PENDI|nr:Methyltransferase small [Penicillium digitatum]
MLPTPDTSHVSFDTIYEPSEDSYLFLDTFRRSTDVNRNACIATRKTAMTAIQAEQQPSPRSVHIASLTADLCAPLRPGSVDVLLFNPPYVPTEDLPRLPSAAENDPAVSEAMSRSAKFDNDSYFLSLTYAGGADGMETTDRLLDAIPGVLSVRGVAYVLLCKQNRPEQVMDRIRGWGGWQVETAGSSGMQAGWEKLVIWATIVLLPLIFNPYFLSLLSYF